VPPVVAQSLMSCLSFSSRMRRIVLVCFSGTAYLRWLGLFGFSGVQAAARKLDFIFTIWPGQLPRKKKFALAGIAVKTSGQGSRDARKARLASGAIEERFPPTSGMTGPMSWIDLYGWSGEGFLCFERSRRIVRRARIAGGEEESLFPKESSKALQFPSRTSFKQNGF